MSLFRASFSSFCYIATELDGHHLQRGQSNTMAFLGLTLNSVLAKYWILLCGLMFLIISLQGTVDIFKIIYMLLFLILLNIFMVSLLRLIYKIQMSSCSSSGAFKGLLISSRPSSYCPYFCSTSSLKVFLKIF